MKKLLLILTISTLALTACLPASNSSQPALKASVDDLSSTEITATWDTEIKENENLIFCSTFQLAWNELKNDIIKEDIHLTQEPPLVNLLNSSLLSKDDLAENSYLAMAGFGKDGIINQINTSLQEKFSNPPTVSEDIEEEDILAYAYLFKNLEFEEEFEKIEDLKVFESLTVPGFGIEEYDWDKHKDLGAQVEIYDYQNDDDFIIKLISKEKNDEIILAKIEPKDTLEETYQEVVTRMENGEMHKMAVEDTLQIPKFDYELEKSFEDLLLKFFTNSGFQDYFIAKAIQNIKFKMNEKGVVLESEAIIVGELAAMEEELPKRLIFNKEFLLILKQKDSENPYFLMWVGNPDLLVKE